jgi:GNAT superfamily N-acetyltransferase
VRPGGDSRIVVAAATRRTMTSSTPSSASTAIRFATAADVPTILHFIRSLARYEKLEHEVVVDEARLHTTLFGARPAAEVLLASHAGSVVGFALFFTNYSTFLGKPGIYLEDLFVEPAARGRGAGLALMSALAKIAVDRDYGRFEWAVLDWNTPALDFYRSLGAQPQSEWTVQRVVGEPLAALARRWPGNITS